MAAPNHVADLQDAVHNLLNQREQTEFVSILSNYRCRNNIQDLVHGLLEMLDTPAKGQLAQLLRKAIPSRDLRLYDELMGGGYTSQSLPRRMASHKDDLGTISKSTGNLYRAGSTLSIPAGAGTSGQHYGTLPSRQTGRVIQRQQSVPQDLNRIPAAKAPMWDVGLAPRLKRIRMSQPNNPNESLGFSIRGGAEHGIGIYVSYVDVESLAERQGLVPGDQILSVNGIPYMKIFHDEAAKDCKAGVLDKLTADSAAMLSVHCIAHRLELACQPTLKKDCKYFHDVANLLK